MVELLSDLVRELGVSTVIVIVSMAFFVKVMWPFIQDQIKRSQVLHEQDRDAFVKVIQEQSENIREQSEINSKTVEVLDKVDNNLTILNAKISIIDRKIDYIFQLMPIDADTIIRLDKGDDGDDEDSGGNK